MGFKKWSVKKNDKQLAKSLSEECDIDPIVALIAAARGYSDPSELEQFLSDEPCISDPHELADIEKAAECINNEIENNTRIAIFGDYDCDGVTSTALLYNYLKSRNADCFYYIPDRFDEGYGMNTNAVDKIHEMGAGLIITVDNGITCMNEISHANELGMKVVVTDHHIALNVLPDAQAVVDPNRRDCPSTYKTICGAEVTFKLICVLENKEPEELLPYFADLLSLAIVADVMPLNYENRSILKIGIQKCLTSPNTGISAIMNVAGIAKNSVNSGKIAFGITPRINAAGRMGKAERAVELLTTDNMLRALEIANEIDADNAERQKTEKLIFTEAVEKIDKYKYNHDRIIVVEGEGWHHGIVGIVASKITEKYGCPSIIISTDGDKASGSGRSYTGFSLYSAIASCSDLLTKFGGHELAAGISLDTEKIPEFRKRVNEFAFNMDYVPPVLNIDCFLNPSAMSIDIAEAIKELEPFGMANQVPLFGIYAVTLQRITPIGAGKHLRLLFSKGNNSFQALLFGVTPSDFCFEIGDILDIAVTLDVNLYNDNYNLSVQIKALRMNGTDDDKLFMEIDNYNKFLTGRKFDYAVVTPSRDDIGTVYKYLLTKSASLERLQYFFINSLGYAKIMIAIKTLSELNLINNEKNLYYAVNNAVKTDLKKSGTYKLLLESGDMNEC